MIFSWPILMRRVQGHSMLPTLPPGTVVWGMRWTHRLRPGAVIVCTHGDREIIKRIERVEAGGLFVVGDHAIASTDSRHFGLVPKKAVKAVVVWPRTPLPGR